MYRFKPQRGLPTLKWLELPQQRRGELYKPMQAPWGDLTHAPSPLDRHELHCTSYAPTFYINSNSSATLALANHPSDLGHPLHHIDVFRVILSACTRLTFLSTESVSARPEHKHKPKTTHHAVLIELLQHTTGKKIQTKKSFWGIQNGCKKSIFPPSVLPPQKV